MSRSMQKERSVFSLQVHLIFQPFALPVSQHFLVFFFLLLFMSCAHTHASQGLNRSVFVPRFLRRHRLCATVSQRQVFEFWGDFISAFLVSFFTLAAFVLSVLHTSLALLGLFKITEVHHETTSWPSRGWIKRKRFTFSCFPPIYSAYSANYSLKRTQSEIKNIYIKISHTHTHTRNASRLTVCCCASRDCILLTLALTSGYCGGTVASLWSPTGLTSLTPDPWH